MKMLTKESQVKKKPYTNCEI